MCTGGCAKVIGISLYVLAAVSIICNIILFFPDWSTEFGPDHITEEVKYMGGVIGGGIMVIIPAIHIHLTSTQGCCNNRCGMFLSIGFAAAGVMGALYSLSAASLGLANGPLCFWNNPQNHVLDWGTPFLGRNESYLEHRELWDLCIKPQGVVEFNVVLFSILLITAGVELVLCLIQMVNGLFGCLCGTCSGNKLSGNVDYTFLDTCQPHTHLMFLKTHKTASSTILNVLYRFGEFNNLRFALPLGYRLGYPFTFNVHRVKGYRGGRGVKYDIMANHLRFNKSEVEKVLHEDTFYFSILRNPLALAESSFAYFHDICPAFRKARSLGAFADNPSSFYKPHLRNNHYARNLLWFDFGMDPNANVTRDLVLSGLTMIRKTFGLILVSEHFDQSMVLLRHALCWPLDAVVSFTLNAAHYRQPKGGGGGDDGFDVRQPLVDLSMTPAQREKLREWNALDWHLYQALNHSFWEDVRRFGPERMDQEVALLRARRDQLARVCLRNGGRPVEAQRIRDEAIRPYQCGSVRILGYELQPGLDNATTEACLRLIRPEMQYKDLLDAKQFPRSQPYARDPARQLDVNGEVIIEKCYVQPDTA
ncbi:unnamed protein product [Lota lota]